MNVLGELIGRIFRLMHDHIECVHGAKRDLPNV